MKMLLSRETPRNIPIATGNGATKVQSEELPTSNISVVSSISLKLLPWPPVTIRTCREEMFYLIDRQGDRAELTRLFSLQ